MADLTDTDLDEAERLGEWLCIDDRPVPTVGQQRRAGELLTHLVDAYRNFRRTQADPATEAELRRYEAALEGVPEGDWHVGRGGDRGREDHVYDSALCRVVESSGAWCSRECQLAIARFIAAARTAVPRLLALVRELYGVIHDLRCDADSVLVEVEREECARLAGAEVLSWGWEVAGEQAKEDVERAIRAIGRCRDPLPPDQLRQENNRLREALRGLVQVIPRGAVPVGQHRRDALAAARAALGEDTDG